MQSDGWNTDPFVLTEKDGKLFGRGATDDKGPVAGWFNCIEAFRDAGIGLPINIKVSLPDSMYSIIRYYFIYCFCYLFSQFVFEAMEESGSVGLEEFLEKESAFFSVSSILFNLPLDFKFKQNLLLQIEAIFGCI